MKIRLSFLLCAALVTLPQIRADETCDVDYSLYNGNCYRFYKKPLSTYEEAREICLRDDADLVSIHNAFENAYVENMDKNGALIGLMYYQSDDSYKWSDGSSLDYTSFADGFVDYRDFYGYCAKNVKGKWTNVECETDRLEFICKKKAFDVVITSSFECPNATTVYFSSGMILSPGYPEPFDFDQPAQETGCYYRLAGKNGYSMRIKIDEYSITEQNGGITIYRGWKEGESNEAARIGSDLENGEIILDYNLVLLHLTNATHGKYKLTWNTLQDDRNGTKPDECPDANRIYYAPNMILSPGYPSTFNGATGESVATCRYRLSTVYENHGILVIEDVHFDENKGQIEIFKGWSENNENLLSRYDATSAGTVLRINADKALLVVNTTLAGSYKINWYPNPCDDGWYYYSGNCYYFDANLVSHAEAEAQCTQRDSTMASIASAAENAFVQSILSSSSDWTWIGLVYTGSWHWMDGSALKYTNWDSDIGEPNSPSSYPVAIILYGVWHTTSESSIRGILCKQNIKNRGGG